MPKLLERIDVVDPQGQPAVVLRFMWTRSGARIGAAGSHGKGEVYLGCKGRDVVETEAGTYLVVETGEELRRLPGRNAASAQVDGLSL